MLYFNLLKIFNNNTNAFKYLIQTKILLYLKIKKITLKVNQIFSNLKAIK